VRIDATNAAGTQRTADFTFRTLSVTTTMVNRSLDRALDIPAASFRAKTLLRKGYYVHTFSAPLGGQISVRWTARVHGKTTTIARGQARSASASQLHVRAALTGEGRVQLKRLKHGSLRITLSATFVTAGRAAITRAKQLLLRP
jgi:hypothetical protein